MIDSPKLTILGIEAFSFCNEYESLCLSSIMFD